MLGDALADPKKAEEEAKKKAELAKEYDKVTSYVADGVTYYLHSNI